MTELTEGVLDDIMRGLEVERPVLQVLGTKKLASSGSGERFRLLVSDGTTVSSFTMLATQLNDMVNDGLLSEFSIVEITRYILSNASNSGKPRRIMVILGVEVKKPGHEVGRKLGNPVTQATSVVECEVIKPTIPTAQPTPKPPQRNAPQNNRLNESINSGTDVITTPIAALSPYQNRWVIKARVSNKSEVRTWNNSRGEGKLFNMDLVDESGEIRCTAFREQVDKFYNMIEIQKIYYISRGVVKLANKTFNNLKNEYEITLSGESEVIPCHDDSNEIPLINYEFRRISEIENIEKGEVIDLIGIVKFADNIQSLTSKAGRDLRKRDINLVDESNTMVTLTLWGTQADNFDGANNPVVAIKGVKIGEFNGGKNLSSTYSSVMLVDPDLPEAHKLRGWFQSVGQSEEPKSLSKVGGGGSGMTGTWVTLDEASARGARLVDAAETFICKATVNIIRHENAMYQACPSEGCNKKLVDVGEMFRCEKCNREYPNFKSRLLAHIAMSDWTSTVWATAFHDEAEKMLGTSAQELRELNDNNHDEFVSKFTDLAFHSFTFKLRMKMGSYNDQAKMNTTIVGVSPVMYKTYNSHLIKEIKKIADVQS